jgi:hypothetical protein
MMNMHTDMTTVMAKDCWLNEMALGVPIRERAANEAIHKAIETQNQPRPFVDPRSWGTIRE